MAKTRKTEELDLGGWCILRMASADTIPLVESLQAAGLNVWTPIERKTGRRPRTRKEYDKELPIMPSYAFAAVEALDELSRLCSLPMRKHPKFSLFKYGGGFPIISDDALLALREEEARCRAVYDRHKRKVMKGPTFDKGLEVTTNQLGFEGLSGVVEGSQGQYTLVSFAGFHKPIKISSLLLQENVQADDCADVTAMAS